MYVLLSLLPSTISIFLLYHIRVFASLTYNYAYNFSWQLHLSIIVRYAIYNDIAVASSTISTHLEYFC